VRSEVGFARFGSCIEARVSGRRATLETNISLAAPSHAPGIGVDCSRNGESSRSHEYHKQLVPHGLPSGFEPSVNRRRIGQRASIPLSIGTSGFNKTFEL
jgi:hypothetical protein